MKTYEETIQTVFSRVKENRAVRKKRNKRFLSAAVPVCFACLAVLVGSGIGVKFSYSPEAPSLSGEERPVSSSSAILKTDTIIITEIDDVSQQRCNIALHREDFIPMSEEVLCDYYGVNIFPVVPDDLKRTNEEEDGIFKRSSGKNAGTIYWDTNRIIYGNDNTKRYAGVEVDKGVIPTDFCNLLGDPEQCSEINGKTVFLGRQVEALYDPLYYAEFFLDDAGFRVVTEGISEEEFLSIVRSLLK